MTAPRKAITLKTKVAVLERQAMCARCGQPLDGDVEYDHILAHALGGSDGPENIRAVHKACHAVISNGTKATTAGSTKHVVAKVKRLEKLFGKQADLVRRDDGTFDLQVHKPKRKIQSPGFQKPPPGHKHFPAGRKVGA